jgi:hypothetical protein
MLMYKALFVVAEIDMMKERFAKLLLGEDMSGGAKGVCTALAISNAITNLSGREETSFFLFFLIAPTDHTSKIA